MQGEKFRFRFSKTGDLRFVGHLDLMRCLERMLRRAALPFKSTAGFHPSPRLVLALSLPLGVTGRNEVLELELVTPLDKDNVLTRLVAVAPAGLDFLCADVVEMKSTAVPRRAMYRYAPPIGIPAEVAGRAEQLLAQNKVWVNRLRPKPRQLNIRPYLRDIRVRTDAVEFDIWVTAGGTARADELVSLLGLADPADAVPFLERTDLELHDETPPGQPDGPPTDPAETRPLIHPPADGDDDRTTARATWGLSPAGPMVE
ncbi:MAG TPA: TIGR03936 family radical SAM-associated protein [Fimbriiglobus sp.]|jgi:radical SAM-linked protein